MILSLWALACTSPFEPGPLVRPTVDEDPSLPATDLLDTRLHLREVGDPDNPVMFLLHGGPGADSRYMEALLEPFPDGYRLEDDFFVVVFDQRGTGLSRRHDEPELLTWQQYRVDLEALVERYSPDAPVVLVGHSGGGVYATNYINANPERVAAAVLLEPGPLSGDFAEQLGPTSTDVAFFGELVSDFFFSQDIIGSASHETADFQLMMVRLEGQEFRGDEGDFNPQWRFGAWVTYLLALPRPEYDFTTNLDAFTTKALFVGTDLTEDVGFDYQRDVQAPAYPSAEVVQITGVGHETMMAVANIGMVQAPIRAYLAELGLVDAP